MTQVLLASPADTSSFLLPVLGFADRAAADRYIQQGAAAENFSFGERFEPVHLSSRSYIPPFGARHDDWQTNRVFDTPFLAKPVWVKLRDKNTQKVPGSYNLALMVEGPRTFYRHVRHSAKVPPYLYRIAEGQRDCFAVWSGFDGRELLPIFRTANGLSAEGQPSQRVFAARSGRGVLYGRVGNYSSSGELSGFSLRVVQVEFTILDRDAARDDMMRVSLSTHISHSYQADKRPTVSTDHLDDAWKQLIERAEAGFNRWCRETPEDVEAWRVMFIDQKAKALADRELSFSDRRQDSFVIRVEGMDWRAALAEVQEAWQLQVVVNVHCDSKFDDSQHRCDSNGHRVGVMLSRVENAERRAALSKMVSDFVAPCDKLWSYTGD